MQISVNLWLEKLQNSLEQRDSCGNDKFIASFTMKGPGLFKGDI